MSIVVGKDGREHILSACDSTFALMGDTQEDDRRHVADLVVTRMQVRRSILMTIFSTLLLGNMDDFTFLDHRPQCQTNNISCQPKKRNRATLNYIIFHKY